MKRILIGRDANRNFFIDDLSVSRNHAELNIENGKITLVDLKSTNGTFVLRGRQPIPIDQLVVTAQDKLFFGTSGPHLVKDILYACRECTEFVNTKLVLESSDGIMGKTKPGQVKIRCVNCGSVVDQDITLCPDCGGVLT